MLLFPYKPVMGIPVPQFDEAYEVKGGRVRWIVPEPLPEMCCCQNRTYSPYRVKPMFKYLPYLLGLLALGLVLSFFLSVIVGDSTWAARILLWVEPDLIDHPIIAEVLKK